MEHQNGRRHKKNVERLTQQLGRGGAGGLGQGQGPSRGKEQSGSSRDGLMGARSLVSALPSTLSDVMRMNSRDFPVPRQPSDLWQLPTSFSSSLDDINGPSPRLEEHS